MNRQTEPTTTCAATAAQPSEFMTIEDVARDFLINRGSQAAMRSRGQIPFYKLGGGNGRIIRYRRSELEAWVTARAAGAR